MVYGGIAMAIIVTAFAAPAMAADAETSWIDEQRAMETKRMVREVLADSQFRTSLSGDTSPVTVDLGGFAITRWNYNNGGGSVQNNEFSIPYARLEVSGRIMDKVDYVVSGEQLDIAILDLLIESTSLVVHHPLSGVQELDLIVLHDLLNNISILVITIGLSFVHLLGFREHFPRNLPALQQSHVSGAICLPALH